LFLKKSYFVSKEVNLLKRRYKVSILDVEKRKTLISKILFLLKNLKRLKNARIIYLYFGGPFSTLATIISKLLGKKVIIHCGGFETVRMPEIGYGAQNSLIKRLVYNLGFRLADYVWCSSRTHMLESKKNTGIKKFDYIYPFFDPKKFKPSGKKENLIITVGGVNKLTWKKKGIKTFVDCAKKLPEYTFVVIGKVSEDMKQTIDELASIENLKFTGYVSESTKIKYMQRAKVYCQLSAHESFGWALAEAMLCECAPVVTRRGALPEVVGDCGIYVRYGDVNGTVKAIRKAIRAQSQLGKRARERVMMMFNESQRAKKLFEVVDRLLGASK